MGTGLEFINTTVLSFFLLNSGKDLDSYGMFDKMRCESSIEGEVYSAFPLANLLLLLDYLRDICETE